MLGCNLFFQIIHLCIVVTITVIRNNNRFVAHMLVVGLPGKLVRVEARHHYLGAWCKVAELDLCGHCHVVVIHKHCKLVTHQLLGSRYVDSHAERRVVPANFN